jgi:hypothetical protein
MSIVIKGAVMGLLHKGFSSFRKRKKSFEERSKSFVAKLRSDDDSIIKSTKKRPEADEIFQHTSLNPLFEIANPVIDDDILQPLPTRDSKPHLAEWLDNSVIGMRLRSRYSFHGTESDELDVPPGRALTAIGRNADWWIAQDDLTQKIGVIPRTYVTELGM